MIISPDRIHKSIVLRAPHERVWRALTDSQRFGAWFGVSFDGAFVPGTTIAGHITPPAGVNADAAAMMEGHRGRTMLFRIDRIDPMHCFAYGAHPCGGDPTTDHTGEPMTQVTFTLETVPEGTRLEVTETGFDGLPAARRDAAYSGNDAGWSVQLQSIEKYLELPE